MRRLHIAHFVPTYPQRGGVGHTIDSVVATTRAAGHDVELLCYGPGRDTGSGTRLADVVAEAARWRATPGRDPVLARLLDPRRGPELDAVFFHGAFTPQNARLSAVLRRRRRSTATVAFPHDPYDSGLFGGRSLAKGAYWSAVERPYLRRVDAVQVSAPSHEQLLRKRGVRTPTVLAPLGLTTDEVTAAEAVAVDARPRSEPAEPRHRLLFLGRWDVAEKGLDLLFQAVGGDELLRHGTTVRLVGPELDGRARVTALARAAQAPVDLVGWVPDVWPELRAADLLVLPSRKEGFGLVALQALAAGVPCVVSDRAGIVEHVRDRPGVVVHAPDYHGALRRALVEAVEHAVALRTAARAASGAIRAEFSWTRHVTSVLTQLVDDGLIPRRGTDHG